MPGLSDFPKLPPLKLGEPTGLEETRLVEFKEVKGRNPVSSIVNAADDNAVAFLNSEGGRILWGIRDEDHIVVGVPLSISERDKLRQSLVNKLHGIQPPIDRSSYRLILHDVSPPETPKSIFVVELLVDSGDTSVVYYTAGNVAFERVEGAKRKLTGPALTQFIQNREKKPAAPSTPVTSSEMVAFAQRLRRIFVEHGLKETQWERFFEQTKAPFTITLRDLQDDGALIAWVSEAKIKWILETFLIRREWLDGEDSGVHMRHQFDKQPGVFFSTVSSHLDGLIYEDVPAMPEAFFIRVGKGKGWANNGRSDVMVVVRVPIARLSNECIVYRYLSDLNHYPWTYGRTNIQLRAWARVLSVTQNVHCVGSEVDLNTGGSIYDNQNFLHPILERCYRHVWHPEDHALFPDESAVAKDVDSLPQVIEFLKRHNLPHGRARRLDRIRSSSQ